MAKIRESCLHELPQVENGVIRGAKLIGLNSRNNRRYEGKALESAKQLYEGRKVYIDHPPREEVGSDRAFGDWAGVIENVQYRKGDGLYGDVVLRQESAHFKGIVEVASNPKFRKSCGFSHVAEGESHYDGDTEIIESIKSVFSVDLVTDPATTGGIYESVQQIVEVHETVAPLRESVKSLPADNPIRKTLTEMMDGGFMGALSMGGEQKEQPADALSQLTAVLRDTIAALADSLKALAKANKPPAPIVTPPGGKPGEEGQSVPADEDEEDDDMKPEDKEKLAAFESVQRELSEQKAKNLLLESNREATATRVKALANCADDSERSELLQSWPTIEESIRPSHSPGLLESDNDFPRDNPEKFAALLR